MVVLLITLSLMGEIQTDKNMLVIPMPNMAVCQEMQNSSFVVEDNKYTYSVACIDLDESDSF